MRILELQVTLPDERLRNRSVEIKFSIIELRRVSVGDQQIVGMVEEDINRLEVRIFNSLRKVSN